MKELDKAYLERELGPVDLGGQINIRSEQILGGSDAYGVARHGR